MTETDRTENRMAPDGREESPSAGSTPSIMMQYSTQTSRYPVLPDSQIKELVRKAQNGDKDAKDLVVHSNLRLLRSIAASYPHHGEEDLMDYINEGVFGLLNAIEKFNFEKDTKFSTYASIWIKQSVSRYIREKGNVIHIPSHMMDRKAAISRAEAAYRHQCHKDPTEKQLAEEAGLSPEQVRNTRIAYQNVVSLDSIIGEDEDDTLMGIIPCSEMDVEDRIMEQSLLEAVRYLIGNCGLTEKEKQILIYRFGLGGRKPMTLAEVGDIYGLTRERIRQIESKAILKLRRKAWYLREYL